MKIEYRKAQEGDYEQIAELQNKNLISALSKEEQGSGFLSAAFTVEQIKEQNEDLCIIVAISQEKLVGYLCISTTEYNKKFSIPAAMINNYQNFFYKKINLCNYQSFVSGPVCIDKDFRGKGIFAGLYKELFKWLPKEYELGITLISTDNPRSLYAHKKIGMELLGEFKASGKDFWTLALDRK